jgi:hypothetical protein
VDGAPAHRAERRGGGQKSVAPVIMKIVNRKS